MTAPQIHAMLSSWHNPYLSSRAFMTNPVSFRDGTPVYEPARGVEVQDPTQAYKSALPNFLNSRKTDYLANRACGFSLREACQLTGIREKQVKVWRVEDPEFAEWENKRLPELQRTAGAEILRFQFRRNMHMVLKIDNDIIKKAAFQKWENLTEEEYRYLLQVRKHYTPQDLMTLDRALSDDPADKVPDEGIHLHVIVEGNAVTAEEARRAASRELLNRFTVNHELLEGEVLASKLTDNDDTDAN